MRLKRLLSKLAGKQAQLSSGRGGEFVPIVSFPKSGNTYCRAILARLLFGESYSAIPDIHRERAEAGPKIRLGQRNVRLFKSHYKTNQHGPNAKGLKIGKIVWIRRHPLDVFLSYRNYLLLRPEQLADAHLRQPHSFCDQYLRARKELSDEEDMAHMFSCFLVYGTLAPQFRQAGNWLGHTKYWWDYSRSNPCFALKYEELVQDPVKSLSAFAREFGFDDAALERAVMQAKKDTQIDGGFFWKQQVHHYREIMPAALVEKWYALYGDAMREFGYL